jgi:hypothetical protein
VGTRNAVIGFGGMNAGVPGFLAVDAPAVAIAHGRRIHMRRIGAVIWFGNSKTKNLLARGQRFDPGRLLRRGSVFEHQQEADVVAHNRVLVLQIAMQAKPLQGQMFANDRHAEIIAVTPAITFRKRITIMPRGVRAALRFGQQCFPVFTRKTAAIPIGTRVFTAMIEEADVVVLRFQWFDFARDEIVQFLKIAGELSG